MKHPKIRRMVIATLWLLAAFGTWATAAETGGVTAPEIARTPNGTYNVRTANYQVAIDRDGMLQHLCLLDDRGNTKTPLVELFEVSKASFRANGLVSTQVTSMNQTAKDQIEIVISGEQQDPKAPKDAPTTSLPEALKVYYTFGDSEIRIRLVNKTAIWFNFTLSNAAQIAQNIDYNVEVPLPNTYGSMGGPVRSMRVTYSDGAELLFRWQGPGNPINTSEDGGLSGYHWGMRGFTPNSEYNITYRIIPPGRPGMIVLAPPQFTLNTSAPCNIFFDEDEKRLSVSLERKDYQRLLDSLGDRKMNNLRLEYRVIDHAGNEMGKGTVPLDFLKDADPDGKIVKEVVVHPPKRGYFEAEFRVTDDQKVIRPVWMKRSFSVVEALRPVEEERARMSPKFDGWQRNEFVGLGLVRENLGFDICPERGKMDFEKGNYDERFKRAKEMSEATGVNCFWMFFGYTWPEWVKTPKDAYEVYAATLQRYKDYNKYWETTNEPNIYLKSQEYLEMYLKPLKLAAEKVDPDAKIIAPSMVGYGLDFIEEIYKLGAKDYFDIMSVHPYHGTPYDIQFLEWHGKLRALMAKYGDEEKPIWFTECGFGWWDLASQVYNARHNVRRILIQGQYGIPKEHDMYYFTSDMGYHKFFVMENDGTMLPQAVALRARRVRLDGTTYDRHFGFGIRFAHASIYKAKDRQVVVLWTYDNHRTLELKTDAQKAEAFDMWGNPFPVEVRDGKMAVPVSGEPTYVILPPNAAVEPVSTWPGKNVADLTLGAEATASSGATPAGLALDGIWFGGGWTDATRETFPDWLEVSLPIPAMIERVHLYMAAGSLGGCITDMNVFASVDDKYVKVAEVRNNTDATLDLQIKPVMTQKVKLEILAGQQNTTIYEVELFAAESGEEATQRSNYALAENGATASASSVWRMEAEVPEEDPNAPAGTQQIKTVAEYLAEQAIDGKFSPNTWQEYTRTVWIDGTPKEFPDWLQVNFAGKKTITAVIVFVNNYHRWKAFETGVSDCDLQVWDGADWKTVGSVEGNKKGIISYVLKEPVQTEKMRLMIKDSNDHLHSAVMEVQAWGPTK
ncbi:MAG: discoidin domain-containing protein [Phycisphaerae bacterium]